MHSCSKTPGSGASGQARRRVGLRPPLRRARPLPRPPQPSPSQTRTPPPRLKEEGSAYKRCHHLETYGLARTAETALHLPLSAPHERVPEQLNGRRCSPTLGMAKAVVDRITHRAHIYDTGTDSWRFRHGLERRTKKGDSHHPEGRPATPSPRHAAALRLWLLDDGRGHQLRPPDQARSTWNNNRREVGPLQALPRGHCKWPQPDGRPGVARSHECREGATAIAAPIRGPANFGRGCPHAAPLRPATRGQQGLRGHGALWYRP